MQSSEAYLILAGRLLLAAIYLWSGTHKIFNPEGTQQYMMAYGLTFATSLLYLGATLFEIGGGVSLALGATTREASIMLVIFMILVTLIFHTHLGDPNQIIHLLKNLAITGGLLYVWANGPGPISRDAQTSMVADDEAAQRYRATLSLIGRLLLATIFLVSGVTKLLDPQGTQQHMAGMGILWGTELFYAGAVVIEIGGGLSLLLGVWTKLGAAALIFFMMATTVIFHRTSMSFVIDATVQDQQFHLMKNLALIGGLVYVSVYGPGYMSVDHWSGADLSDERDRL
jgi:putative oxidoreductase